ncbi:MAG: hypothetical protein J2O48_06490, partial [Solirubrobacterales bacterium]|nr:hypothetical protein [Solirubrobacterales bacterium]
MAKSKSRMPATSTKPKKPAAKRKPAAKKQAPPTRARRTHIASAPALRAALELEPHQVDILALALIALGIFLGGVTYLHWGGGSLGHGIVTGFRLLMGVFAYLVPLALILGGGLLLGRELRSGPPTRPLRTGTLCLFAGLTLALAAGTLGIGPGKTPANHFWAAHVLENRGGVIGGVEFWVLGHLLSTAGADIVA